MFLTVTRIMLPVMVAVYIAERLGLVRDLGTVLAPAFGLLGLPPQAGVVWVTTVLTNIWGGLATLAALAGQIHMTTAQVSALGAMMLFAHNLPTEQSIVRRAGASALLTGALRIAMAILYGGAVMWACRAMGWLAQPVSLDWMRRDAALGQGVPDVLDWALSTLQSLGMVMLVILGLVVAMDILGRLGITRIITRLLTPVLRLSGLEDRAAPLTTVGVLLGLTYGGALIIDAAEREHYSPRTRLLALSWLSLCHAVIEDSLLILALGANIWVIMVFRVAVTLIVLAVMARLTQPGTRWGRRLEARAELAPAIDR